MLGGRAAFRAFARGANDLCGRRLSVRGQQRGFEQYLYNSSGTLAGELLDALRAVGAERAAEIYRAALAALPAAWLKDEEERRTLLDEVLTERVSEMFDQCDQRFYECSGDLEELLYRCIVQNWRSFE